MPQFWAGLMVHMDVLFKMTEIAASINFEDFGKCTVILPLPQPNFYSVSFVVDNRTYYLTFSISVHTSGSREEDEAETILFRTVEGESVLLKNNLM